MPSERMEILFWRPIFMGTKGDGMELLMENNYEHSSFFAKQNYK